MKGRRLLVLVFAALMGWTGIAAAQQSAEAAPAGPPATREDILKMMEVMRSRKQMESAMTIMTTQLQQQMREMLKKQPPLPPERQAALEKILGEIFDAYPAREMLDDMIPVYQRHFSKPDVDATVAFYSSPAGQHLLDQMPALMQDVMSTVMGKMQTRMDLLKEKMEKEVGGTPTAEPAK